MAEQPAPASSWGPSSPSDPRVAALLGLIWRHGLFPTIVAGAFLFLLWSLAGNFTRSLEALERKVDVHQAAMEAADAATAAAIARQGQRLKGICYGVTEEGSRARAFCDEAE
jgi:hypothetical protein